MRNSIHNKHCRGRFELCVVYAASPMAVLRAIILVSVTAVNCIMNAKQTALYMKYGVKLLDVLVSKDDKLVYVFDKIDSRELYKKWMDRELT